jgi:hypothetical protein
MRSRIFRAIVFFSAAIGTPEPTVARDQIPMLTDSGPVPYSQGSFDGFGKRIAMIRAVARLPAGKRKGDAAHFVTQAPAPGK